MTSRPSLRPAACLVFLVAASALPATGSVPRPNILFIMVDTLRTDHVGCYGYGRPTTPNLDRLAATGVRFDQMVSSSSWTLPAVGTMFTGLYPSQHNLTGTGHRMAEGITPLAAVLGQAGYRTAGFTANPVVHSKFGFARGFAVYDDYTAMLSADLGLFGDPPPVPGTAVSPPDIEAGNSTVTNPLVNRFAEAFLAKQPDATAPFFLFLLYFDPHADYVPPPPYNTMFNPGYAGPEVGSGIYRRGPAHPYSPEERQQIVSLYDGEIRNTDEHIGQLLALLDRLALRDNTVVLVLADHGEEFWDHGGMLHGHSLKEELVHVPCILRYPGVLPTDTVFPHQASLLDIMPTLLDLAGVPIPDQCLGRSLLPNLQDASVPCPERLAFLEGTPDSRASLEAVRLPARKLVHDPLADTFEAFDLAADPREEVPLRSPPFPLLPSLREWSAAMQAARDRQGNAAAAPLELDQTHLRQLRSLGYLR